MNLKLFHQIHKAEILLCAKVNEGTNVESYLVKNNGSSQTQIRGRGETGSAHQCALHY